MLFSLTAQQRRFFLLSLPVFLITAWFSVGYHHPDEHFQVLEFCNYKLGLSPLGDLPWEYLTYCRPTVQPFIAYLFARAAMAMGIYSPFLVAFVLRALMATLTWFVSCRMVVLLTPLLKTTIAQKYLAYCMLGLWFVPYIGVRFSAETVSSVCFFGSICLLWPHMATKWSARQVFVTFVSGFLLGLAVFVRLQLAFAVLGFGMWLLLRGRWAWQKWLLLVFGAIIAIGVGVLIDHWFYGKWVFTPFNYFDVNIVHNKAASFGVEPWWYYITTFLQVAGIPISAVLLLLFVLGVRRNQASVFSFIVICFVAGHMAVGHKEMRFLYPVSFAFIYLVVNGIDQAAQNVKKHKGYIIGLRTLIVVNIGMLVFKMCTPAEEAVNYYKFMYRFAADNKTNIVYADRSPYNIAELELNYYKPPKVAITKVANSSEVASMLANNSDEAIICLSQNLKPDTIFQGFRYERIYCAFPDFLLANNFNGWQERSRIWAIFRIYKK